MESRERQAWVYILSTLVAMAGYALAAWRWHEGLGPVARIGLLAVPLSFMGVVSLGAWLMYRGEAPDERDLAIAQRATSVAYGVLMAGFLYVGMMLPFTHGGWYLVHSALAAIVLAELVHSGLVVRGYRRSAA